MLILVGLFSRHHLVLDSQLICSSLGKTTSPTPSFPQLPIVLCIGLRPQKLLSMQFGIFVGVLLVKLMIGQSDC